LKLLVVESPTKTKTLKKFLDKEFEVASTGGHIIDLPKSKLGIDIKNDFKPQYVTIEGKKKIVTDLKKLSGKATKIYLAPDPDREGEAIAFHVANSIGTNKSKVMRVTFNEITKKAVLDGIKNAGKIDIEKVNAQQARRILDRIVGYQISPILWKTITMGLSAGRVQSVALRLICEREEEILNFVTREFWRIDGEFQTSKQEKLTARLIKMDGEKVEPENEASTNAICNDIKKQNFKVSLVKKGSAKRQSPPPFITSSLQQDAFTKLGFNNKKTMLIAQQLYEGIEVGEEGQVGLITYMRTDSFHIASEAKAETAKYITKNFGEQYLPKYAKKYKTKKAAQEAHEAIRPTSINREPSKIKSYLTKDQLKLYQLIWARFLASQMADAEFKTNTVEIVGGKYVFRAFKQELSFDGFIRIYNGSTGDDEDIEKIPALKENDKLSLLDLKKEQHFTQPPPRFNAGSLVKELEEKGIGRPSTYAQIISTLTDRKYVNQEQKRFSPTDLGKLVNKILVENFPDIFNTEFTAEMEDELDKIEEGNADWIEVLKDFYEPFAEDLKKVDAITKEIKKQTVEQTDEICDKCGKPMVIKYGRNGRFLACSGYPECKNTKPLNGEVEKTDKKCPKCGSPMEIRRGRFGRFLACSRYPECKTTESVSTNVKCPEKDCGGEILERTSKRGRIFYSCSHYPKCKFSSWSKPVSTPCPACGHPYMVEKSSQAKGQYLYCPNCKHSQSEKEPETAEASIR
jgi:DNA topoisomerase-1